MPRIGSGTDRARRQPAISRSIPRWTILVRWMWKTAHVQAPAMVIHLIFGHPIRRARQHGLGRLALLDFTVLDA